ncbi:MAG: DsbA family protein, partial [Longimicrobiales bacterium]
QDEKFGNWAVELGLDDQRFATCWEQDPSKEVLDRNTKLARSLGVRGTPTFLVNGKVVVGALPYEDFAAILEEAAKGR